MTSSNPIPTSLYVTAVHGTFEPSNETPYLEIYMVTSDMHKALVKAGELAEREWSDDLGIEEFLVFEVEDGGSIEEGLVNENRIFVRSV